MTPATSSTVISAASLTININSSSTTPADIATALNAMFDHALVTAHPTN
jgi:hypothetical protein